MRKVYKLSLTVFTALALSISVFAQNYFFTDMGQNRTVQASGQRVIIPQKFRTSSLDVQSMKRFLWTLPSEQAAIANRSQMPVLELPMPNGIITKFRVWESSIQEPGLQAKFPDIKTFTGQGIDDPYATVRFDIGPSGFHAQVLTPNGTYYIDPFSRGDINNYISYFRTDFLKQGGFLCEVPENPSVSSLERTEAVCLGTNLRTYRLAVACTGEYAQAPGIAAGTNAAILHAAIVTTVNRVVGVYEKEVSVRMVLVANNNLVEFLNAGTDPFTGNTNANVLINESQTVIDANIGSANYDIGHTFSTGGGGLAQLSSVCGSGKARGITGSSNPTGDGYDIDFVAHEMGHQFGGNHSFNGQVGNCSGGNRNGATAYEPGSGTTIQAYAGICGSDDIQPNSDPFFHGISIDEISNFVNGAGGSCAVLTATGNTLPVINALPNNGLSIPPSTPFTLSGSATDANGDALTYCWEEWDLGPQSAWNAGASAAAGNTLPLYKSRVPKTTGERTFPDISVILAGFPANPAATMNGLKGEVLSSVARPMNFRLTVRDNRAGGGAAVSSGGNGCQTSTPYTVNVVGTTPFTVTTPNGGETYPASSNQTITWNNAGTNAAPFNVTNVKISLSTDGGLTFPTVLSASTPNDGSESLTIPSIPPTNTAKVKIEAIGNIFFDISNANFSISLPLTGFSFGATTPTIAACPAPATMDVTLPIISNSGYIDPVTLSAIAGVPAGTTVTFGTNPVVPGNSSVVTLNAANTLSPGTYNVTIQGTGPAPAVTLTTTVTFTINPGSGPTINTQPASQIACSGTNATFTIAATGVTGYQWQVSTVAVPAFTNLGITTPTLNLTAVTAGMSGNQYRCVLTGQCGTSTSSAATLTVNVAPAITTNPSPITICSGSPISFTAAASGTPAPTYKWQISTIAVPAFTDIPGEVTATLNIATVTAGMNGNQYRCVATNSCGSVNTTAALLTVNPSIVVTTNPANQTICEGTNVSFTTLASGGVGLTYTWEVSTNGGTSYTAVTNGGVYSGATTATLTLTGVPATYNNYRYRSIGANGFCLPGTSTAAVLTVNTLPSITAAPQNVTICENSSATFNVTALPGVGTLTYQWQFSPDGVIAYSNITGATASSFAQTSVPATQTGYRYRVVATAGCGSVSSAAGIMTVNKYPVVDFTLSTPICKSDQAFALSASPAGGTFSGTGVSSGQFNPTAAGVGAKVVTYTATNAGCATAVSRTVVVNECAERHLTLDKNQAIVIYPNPNNGSFGIGVKTDLYSTLNIKVYNTKGEEVNSQPGVSVYYGSVIPVRLFNIPSGTYLLYINGAANGQIHKRGDRVVIYK